MELKAEAVSTVFKVEVYTTIFYMQEMKRIDRA